MSPHIRTVLLASIIVALPNANVAAQSEQIKVTPISDLRPDWLYSVVASPDERFFLLSTDSALLTYDRVNRRWGTLGERAGNATRFQWSPDGRNIAYDRNADGLPGRYIWIQPVDPTTGVAKAPARRVSTMRGTLAAWSPDSRRIAFVARDSTHFVIATVPFNGGEEHVVFRGPGTGLGVLWSPDGKYLYTNYGPPGSVRRLVRITIASGKADSLRARPGGPIGVSSDGKFIAFEKPSELLIYNTANGNLARDVHIPPLVTVSGWSRKSPAELIAIQHIIPSSIQSVSLADGKIRTIVPVDSSWIGATVYSPDGRTVAFSSHRDGGRLMLVGSDGSHLRAIGSRAEIVSELGISWSPTGRNIAYLEASPLAIHAVDVASGRDRVIVPNARVAASDPFEWPFAWRADGQAVRYFGPALPGPGAKHEVREISLDGKDRLLTTVTTEGLGKANFINDTLVEITGPNEIRGISLLHGTVRSLYSGPVRNFLGGHVNVSKDGSWIAFSAKEGDNEVPRIVSLVTGESRRIPYSIGSEVLHVMFHPNGRDLIVSACPTCNAGVEKWEILQVPMNGDPPKMLTAQESKFAGFGVPSISPDGRSIVFEAEHSYNTRIVRLTLPKQ